jgi:hypothetical protein
MREIDRWKDVISQILRDAKGHLKSLDILEYGYDLPTPLSIFPQDFLFSFTMLETLFITPYNMPQEEEEDRNPSITMPVTSLHTVGWRFRPFDPKKLDAFSYFSRYFSVRRFPNLSTILYPKDFARIVQ